MEEACEFPIIGSLILINIHNLIPAEVTQSWLDFSKYVRAEESLRSRFGVPTQVKAVHLLSTSLFLLHLKPLTSFFKNGVVHHIKTRVDLIKLVCAANNPKADGKEIF